MTEYCALPFCRDQAELEADYCYYHGKMLKGYLAPNRTDLYVLPGNGDFWRRCKEARKAWLLRFVRPNALSQSSA